MFYALANCDDFVGLADLGKVSATAAAYTASVQAQAAAYKAKLAALLTTRKAARCAKLQAQEQQTYARQVAQVGHVKSAKVRVKHLARLTSAYARKVAVMQKRCSTQAAKAAVATVVAAVPLSAILPIPPTCQAGDPTCDPNTALIDQADYASTLQDWQSCMQGEATCTTDDCGPSATDPSVCDTVENYCGESAAAAQQDGCYADWQQCKTDYQSCVTADNAQAEPGVTACQASNCGLKPIAQAMSGMSGLGAETGGSMLWWGVAGVVLFLLLKKAKR